MLATYNKRQALRPQPNRWTSGKSIREPTLQRSLLFSLHLRKPPNLSPKGKIAVAHPRTSISRTLLTTRTRTNLGATSIINNATQIVLVNINMASAALKARVVTKEITIATAAKATITIIMVDAVVATLGDVVDTAEDAVAMVVATTKIKTSKPMLRQ